MPLIGPVSGNMSGSLSHLGDGTSYLIAGSNVTISTGSGDAVTIASTIGAAQWSDAGGILYPADGVAESVGVGATSNTATDYDIYLSSDGAAVFNEQGASVDFRVESNTKTHALFINAGADQVLILSGGAAASANESNAADINFYVSGTVGSRGTSTRGTTVFGGDLVVSGGMTVGFAPSESGDAGSDQSFKVNTKNYSNRLLVDGDNDQVVIAAEGDGGVTTAVGTDTLFHVSGAIYDADFGDTGDVSVFGGDVLVSGTLALYDAGSNADHGFSFGALPGVEHGSDVIFYVSGVAEGKDTADSGIALFAGDVTISGTFYPTRTNLGDNDFLDSALSDSVIFGDTLTFGSGVNGAAATSSVVGKLYYMDLAGQWRLASASSVSPSSSSLLAVGSGGVIAIGGGNDEGLLNRGLVDVDSYFSGSWGCGQAVYMASGSIGADNGSQFCDASSLPGAAGQFLRILGHMTPTTGVIFFNPSSDWITLA